MAMRLGVLLTRALVHAVFLWSMLYNEARPLFVMQSEFAGFFMLPVYALAVRWQW